MASTISAGTTTTTALVQTADTSGVLQLQTNGTTTAVTIDTSQNVGVGVIPSAVTNTYQTFQIGNIGNALTGYKSYPIIRVDNNCYISGGVSTYAVSGYKASSIQQYNGAVSFSVSTDATQTAGNAITFNQAMTLASSGNLLVGTGTDPGTGYTGVFQTNSTSGAAGFYFYNSSASAIGNGVVSVSNTATSGTNYLFYGVSGASAINTGTQAFIVKANGNVVNINNSYGPISDIKLKENIVDATPKLDDLMKVRIVNYNLKADLGYENHKQIGVIAQELEQVFAGLVDESPDKDKEGNALGTTTKSVKMTVFIPILIKAIQELSAQVTTLQTQVTALKG